MTKIKGRYAGKVILTNLVNFIGEPSTALMCKKFIHHHEYRWTPIKPAYDIIDIPIWLNMLSQGDLYYFAEPLSCFRLHGQNAQAKFSVLTGGAVCWSELIQKAWKEKCFLESEADYQKALHGLLRMGLPLYQSPKLPVLDEEERIDFEKTLGQAFIELSKLPFGEALK